MALTGTGAVDVSAAADDPLVSLPSEADRAADRHLTTADDVRIGPETFDVDAAGEIALSQVDRFSGPDWDIGELAQSLGADPEAAFALVRDHIGFDPYAGVLRGARGTLAARAGNAWDRALLLQALLEAQGHETQLASGHLDDAAVIDVLARTLSGPIEPLDDPDAGAVRGLDLEALTNRARRDHALLADGLGPERDRLGADISPRLADAVADHAWVQVEAADGERQDLDPTLPSMEPGDTLTTSLQGLTVPPDELRHRVGIRVVVETLTEGELADKVVLEEWLDAADAADSETWLTFQAEGSGLGGALLDAISDVAWKPVLDVAGNDRIGEPFTVSGGGDASDFFFGGGEPELTALRLELESEAPGRKPIVSERILLDRVAPADRLSGNVLPELLEPMPPDGQVLPALTGVHQVLVSNGGSDLRTYAVRRAIALGWGARLAQDPTQADGLAMQDVFFPLATANQLLVLASERLLTDDIGIAGEARAFVGRPRVYLVSFVPEPDIPDGSAIITDLALDDIDVVIAADTPTATAAQVRLWQGVLQTALETELALERSRAVSPDSAIVSSVSLSMAGPPTLLRPSDVESVAPKAAALRRALKAGQLALVVDLPAAHSFWAVDPVSGRTRSVSSPSVRIGSVAGGNHVNSSGGGPRYVVDPETGNTLGTLRDGRFTPANRQPPSRCSGGSEYLVVLGCVSIPASMSAGMVTAVVITAVVSWATVLLELLLL